MAERRVRCTTAFFRTPDVAPRDGGRDQRRPLSLQAVASPGVNGVNRGLLKRLLRAQEDLYRQYREQVGAPVDDADDQKKFKTFCQTKEVIRGQGPRDSGNHRDGSACDIEYLASPWLPIFAPGGGLTGEEHNKSGQWSKDNVWNPCIQVCHRSGLFCLGHTVEPRASADVSYSYDSFKETHDALVKYLSYRYPNGAAGNLTEATEADFIARVKAEKDTALKGSKLSLFDSATSQFAEKDTSAASDDDLKAAFAQIESDRKTMRYGMVIGSLSVAGDKIDETKTNYREPCRGFLMLKKDVVIALKKTGLRWGGQDFRDMMHFDMGFEILNDFLDVPVSVRAAAIVAELSASTDPAAQKIKDAATAIKNAADAAGPAANAASLADNTAKEDACWAVVNSASSTLAKVTAAKVAALKVAKDSRATDEKKQKVLDDADAALSAAKKVEDDAKTASTM